MTLGRLVLKDLTITNGDLPPASVTFSPGFNLITGASDTGKTFIFESIDFMLGAKDGLRRFPQSAGYERISLEVDPSVGSPFTLFRAYAGGEFELLEFANGRTGAPSAHHMLSATHSPDPHRSLSAYLLSILGIGGRQIRKNVQGEKKALSYRHVARLTLIDEERIIQQASPLLSEHDTEHTAEENVFAYFLTGQDDSAIIPQEKPGQKKARLAIEAALLDSLITERTAELAKFTDDPAGLPDQLDRLEAAVSEASQAVIINQALISEVEKRRADLAEDHTAKQSRVQFLEEQLKRLRLLDDYYRTDQARLEAVVEAGVAFHELPEGDCPLCERPFRDNGSKRPVSHANFELACTQERQKIDLLRRDLAGAINDFEGELSSLAKQSRDLSEAIYKLDNELQSTLQPNRSAQNELQKLVLAQNKVMQALTLQESLAGLQSRLQQVVIAQKQRQPRPQFESRATTSSASEFCRVVEGLLRDWRYPDLGAVAFDTEKADLVIGGQNRANKGKGYRAITYAAFAIGLMKYCRAHSIPHPGIVVLDTPLNPYRGPATDSSADNITDLVKIAFFESLASDSSGDQIIVLENEPAPRSILTRANVIEFTKNATFGDMVFFHTEFKYLVQVNKLLGNLDANPKAVVFSRRFN